MSNAVKALEPKLLWSHFADIAAIPRPSEHEEAVIKHVKAWAKERGFEVLQDEAGTINVKVPATKGHESAPSVILQGHLDMVCEKNSDTEHDFMKDGIKLLIDGDWVKADGTTLGADNGIGVAAAMAAADDDFVHGPLEILCTVDEESGLTGAQQLDPSIVSGKILLNLDTEEDGAIYIGCSGGGDAKIELKTARRRAYLGSIPVKMSVAGMRGGHSGLNIIENRGNAIRLAVQVLQTMIRRGLEVDLVSINAGDKHNAIPREAFAVFRIPKPKVAVAKEIAADVLADFMGEFGTVEIDTMISVDEIEDHKKFINPLNVHARDRLLLMLDGLPNGVLSMSRDVPGLVETSCNLAVVNSRKKKTEVLISLRSSVGPALLAARHRALATARLAGAKISMDAPYPGWKPNPDSAIVKKTIKVHENLLGKKPEVKAIHAGLECGLLIEKIPGLDAVSIGPQIENAHSPDEKVQISTVDRFYTLLKGLLTELA